LIRSLLWNCEFNHKQCRQNIFRKENIKLEDVVFIDVLVGNLTAMEGSFADRWVTYGFSYMALSYIWGGIAQIKLTIVAASGQDAAQGLPGVRENSREYSRIIKGCEVGHGLLPADAPFTNPSYLLTRSFLFNPPTISV
jgi:hypothetical protein